MKGREPGRRPVEKPFNLPGQAIPFFVPSGDLFFPADRPFTESERLFLERIRHWGKKVVVVLNKVDLADARITDAWKTDIRASAGIAVAANSLHCRLNTSSVRFFAPCLDCHSRPSSRIPTNRSHSITGRGSCQNQSKCP